MTPPPPIRACELPVGARLRRQFRGVEHVVEIVRPVRRGREPHWWRYRYRGEVYPTLTAVAVAMGAHPKTSGPRFFGLRR